jgi:hypothetical protein
MIRLSRRVLLPLLLPMMMRIPGSAAGKGKVCDEKFGVRIKVQVYCVSFPSIETATG